MKQSAKKEKRKDKPVEIIKSGTTEEARLSLDLMASVLKTLKKSLPEHIPSTTKVEDSILTEQPSGIEPTDVDFGELLESQFHFLIPKFTESICLSAMTSETFGPIETMSSLMWD